MDQLQKRWEGVTLSGDYTLEKWLGGDDSAAFFQTSIARDGRRAVVKLVPEQVANGPALFDLWERIRQLRHPNLIELIDYGRAEFSGEIVQYAVFEDHDDSLAEALRRAPLSPPESREVLDSALQALQFLHDQGLVMDTLTPRDIVAVGDRVKLWTGALREAAGPSDYANNVKLLGELWQEALLSASPRSSEIVAHATDADPQARWTLGKISAALDGKSQLSKEPVADPSLHNRPAIPSPPPESTSEHASSHRLLTLLLIGGAAVLLLILGFNRPRVADVDLQTQGPAVHVPADTPAIPKTLEPKPRPPEIARSSPPDSAKKWRIIAFTYRSKEAATKKAQELNRHNPGLEATVFSPNDRAGYYLVSLGGRMTREEAVNLQRRARGKGLPRDLYIQNYSH
jgi:eukaryotic-like serine/threonine-protein kinase